MLREGRFNMMNLHTHILQRRRHWDAKSIEIGLISLASFLLLALFLYCTRYEFVQSDAAFYWNYSFNLAAPYDPFHVPAYPAAILLARCLTFGLLPPAAILLGLSCMFFVIGSILFFRILRMLNPSSAFAGSLLFLFFPFVGVAAAVDPRADAMAFMLLLASFAAIQRNKPWWFSLAAALALLTHKALWPFIAFLGLTAFARRNVKLRHLLVLALPTAILWIAGALYHDNAAWMLSQNIEVEMVSRGTWPVLDGILGTLQVGGLVKAVKVTTVVSLLVLSL